MAARLLALLLAVLELVLARVLALVQVLERVLGTPRAEALAVAEEGPVVVMVEAAEEVEAEEGELRPLRLAELLKA